MTNSDRRATGSHARVWLRLDGELVLRIRERLGQALGATDNPRGPSWQHHDALTCCVDL